MNKPVQLIWKNSTQINTWFESYYTPNASLHMQRYPRILIILLLVFLFFSRMYSWILFYGKCLYSRDRVALWGSREGTFTWEFFFLLSVCAWCIVYMKRNMESDKKILYYIYYMLIWLFMSFSNLLNYPQIYMTFC